MAIVLADLVSEKNLALNLRARAENGAIREIVGLLQASGELRDSEKFFDEVIAREESNSTVMENGVAFPHARTEQVERIVLGIGRSVAGVRFGKKEELVNLVFVIGVPRQLTNDYLVCVGALARIVKNGMAREALLSAKSNAEFVELLRAESVLLE